MRRLPVLAVCLLASRLASAAEIGPRLDASPSPDLQEPACLQARAGLPGTITRTSISGHPIRGKRLVIHRGGATLVLDHAVFAATTQAFLDRYGPSGFPEETELLRRFSEELAQAEEIDVDRIVGDERLRQRFDFRLAEVLERGGFEVRGARRASRARTGFSAWSTPTTAARCAAPAGGCSSPTRASAWSR